MKDLMKDLFFEAPVTEVVLWVMMSLSDGHILQASKPVQSKSECQALRITAEVLYSNIETECIKRVEPKEEWTWK